MCSSLKSHLFLLIIAFLLSSTQCYSANSQKDDSLIRSTCQKTANPNLCIQTLKSDPRSLNADVKGLAGIALDIVITKSNDTLNLVGALLKAAKDRGSFERYGTCVEEYNSAVSTHLPQAKSALNSNNYGAARKGLEDTKNDAYVCDQVYSIKQNKLISDLCVITSNITSQLG